MGEVFGKLGIDGPLLLSQIVNFSLLLFLLRATLYKPMLNMLEDRKKRIADSMKDAERVSIAAREAEEDKAQILEEARREAQEIRAQATRDTEKIAQEIRARAEQEAAEIRVKAQEDAQAQIEAAMADINKKVADLAILATEKILGKELDKKAEQKRFIAKFLEQYGSS